MSAVINLIVNRRIQRVWSRVHAESRKEYELDWPSNGYMFKPRPELWWSNKCSGCLLASNMSLIWLEIGEFPLST